MKTIITREEIIPFLNPDGTIMQMANFRISVSIEADTSEEAQAETTRVFDSEKEKLSLIIPALKTKEKRIQFILQKLKQLLPDKFAAIMNEASSIK